MLTGFNPELIQDLEGARQAIVALLNLVEDMKSENQALREEVQRLRDENNRLKGEQGKPDIKPNKQASAKSDHSSEAERRQSKAWRKGRKVERIQIDREERLRVDQGQPPADAVFKAMKRRWCRT
jgi:regulator of replication initiation timing